MSAICLKYNDYFEEGQLQLIKSMYFKGLTDDELMLFLHVCKRTGLDPLLKQIHPVKRNARQDDGTYRMTLTIQTAIDGYRLIAERTGRYAPGREPTFTYDANGKLVSCTAYIKKLTSDGTWHEIPGTAFYEEYCQRDKNGKPMKFWEAMPHGQLSKCAEALAIRKGFPANLSGIYTNEEMQQAEVLDDIRGNKTLEEQRAEPKEIYLELPKDVDPEKIDIFLSKTSEITKRSINDLKMGASKNLKGFLDTFRKWEEKQTA